MKLRYLLIAGVLSLVLIACIFAAGCTSTETASNQAADTDLIIGVWTNTDDNASYVFSPQNSGVLYTVSDSGAEETVFAWAKESDGTYSVMIDAVKVVLTPDAKKGVITTDSGKIYTKEVSDASGASRSNQYSLYPYAPHPINETAYYAKDSMSEKYVLWVLEGDNYVSAGYYNPDSGEVTSGTTAVTISDDLKKNLKIKI